MFGDAKYLSFVYSSLLSLQNHGKFIFPVACARERQLKQLRNLTHQSTMCNFRSKFLTTRLLVLLYKAKIKHALTNTRANYVISVEKPEYSGKKLEQKVSSYPRQSG